MKQVGGNSFMGDLEGMGMSWLGTSVFPWKENGKNVWLHLITVY